MKIKGTYQEEFEITISAEWFNKGEYLKIANENATVEVLKYVGLSTPPNFRYKVREALEGEELEIAIEHFKILTQNLELVRI